MKFSQIKFLLSLTSTVYSKVIEIDKSLWTQSNYNLTTPLFIDKSKAEVMEMLPGGFFDLQKTSMSKIYFFDLSTNNLFPDKTLKFVMLIIDEWDRVEQEVLLFDVPGVVEIPTVTLEWQKNNENNLSKVKQYLRDQIKKEYVPFCVKREKQIDKDGISSVITTALYKTFFLDNKISDVLIPVVYGYKIIQGRVQDHQINRCLTDSHSYIAGANRRMKYLTELPKKGRGKTFLPEVLKNVTAWPIILEVNSNNILLLYADQHTCPKGNSKTDGKLLWSTILFSTTSTNIKRAMLGGHICQKCHEDLL